MNRERNIMKFVYLTSLLCISLYLQCIHGDPSLDDVMKRIDAMTQEQRAMKSELGELRNKVEAINSASFFSAQISEDTMVLYGDTVNFDVTSVNFGNDWIVSGSVYVAPEDGYYLFTLTVREDGDNDCAGIVRRTPATDPTNPVDLCAAEQGDGDWQTGSCSVITPLLTGDEVAVIAAGLEAGEGEDSFYLGGGYTNFVGLQVRSGFE